MAIRESNQDLVVQPEGCAVGKRVQVRHAPTTGVILEVRQAGVLVQFDNPRIKALELGFGIFDLLPDPAKTSWERLLDD